MEKATARDVPGHDTGSGHPHRHQHQHDDEDRLALEHQHTELERQLAVLDRHLSLTPDEQIEQRRLKKQKLLVKDQLLRLGLSASRGA
jgi:hypothetical protein